MRSSDAAFRGRAYGAAMLGCAMLLAGCTTTVSGSAQPDAASARSGSAAGPAVRGTSQPPPSPSADPSASPSPSHTPAPSSTSPAPAGALRDLLPPASAFPDGYAGTAAVLPHRDAVAAAEDLSGVHRGARTEPVRCEPGSQPPGPDGLAVLSATDGATRSTVAVQLERVSGSLEDYRGTIAACTDVTSNLFGAQSTITRTMIDAPSGGGGNGRGDGDGDGGGTVAYRQSVRSGGDGLVLDQRSTTLAAQVGDVRILVVGMTQSGEAPDADELAGLLRASVQAVRAG